MNFNADKTLPSRFFSHARLGFATKVNIASEQGPYEHKPRLVEKLGNGILFIVGSLPRSIKWIGRQFQDPRVVTVALTALALFVATISFYPTVTIAALTTVCLGIKALVVAIPLWSVKLAAYILTSTTIVGFGLRAGGRFANADLMKAFYGLSPDFNGNPSYLTISQIRALKEKMRQTAEEAEDSDAPQVPEEVKENQPTEGQKIETPGATEKTHESESDSD